MPPTVALGDITEAGYIVYLIRLWCQPFHDCWYLHFVCTVQAFLVIAAFLQRLARNWHAAQKFFPCLRGNQRPKDGFYLVRKIVIDRNCSVAELSVRLSAALVAAAMYSRHPTWKQKGSR